MPITVRYKNMQGHECTIRPTPLISISVDMLKTGAGDAYGVNYNITLTGTLLPDEGTPFAHDRNGDLYPFHGEGVAGESIGPYSSFDNGINVTRPDKQKVPTSQAAQAIMLKQRALRALFADDGNRVEITDTEFGATPIVCWPRVKSISFGEGIYVNRSDFTIELEADTLYTYGNVDAEGNKDSSINASTDEPNYVIYNSILGSNEDAFLAAYGNAYIKDFSETWSVETDESSNEIKVEEFGDIILPRKYIITHNISATGKDHYHPHEMSNNAAADSNHATHVGSNLVERLSATAQARKFVEARLDFTVDIVSDVIRNYVGPALWNSIGPGLAAYVMTYYKGFDHQRTENIDKAAGSYAIQDTWSLEYSKDDEKEKESTTISVSTSIGDPFVKVSINGQIKGQKNAGANIGGIGPFGQMAWQNALAKWNVISNNGQFGIGCLLYKRCNNVVAVQLNSSPLSVSIETNEKEATIDYSLEWDNRPTSFITGAMSENISVNDTYPGDVFSVIPVIGRQTGPILQYIGGRTEYKRNVNISLNMDYTHIAYANDRRELILLKPSVLQPQADELADLLEQLSPANEPGVRKYFISPPTETWSPKDGAYNLSLEFTYELNDTDEDEDE